MRVEVHESIQLDAGRETVFDFLASEAGFLSFVGYGPIPGLAQVVFDEGDFRQQGSISRVTNTDGSSHRETIERCDAPHRYAVRIYELSKPFGLLVRELDESWELTETPTGCRLHRCFGFSLQSVLLWPLSLPLAQGLFRLAMRRHHKNLQQRFAR